MRSSTGGGNARLPSAAAVCSGVACVRWCGGTTMCIPRTAALVQWRGGVRPTYGGVAALLISEGMVGRVVCASQVAACGSPPDLAWLSTTSTRWRPHPRAPLDLAAAPSTISRDTVACAIDGAAVARSGFVRLWRHGAEGGSALIKGVLVFIQ